MGFISAAKELFSGLSDIGREPWKSLWIDHFYQYLLVFIVVIILGSLTFWQINLFPTDLNNALYFLSAMAQAQAAIISIVITMTLIAIQMAASAYTPRVVDVMKKNPDMWYLLIIYIIAISYGFFALKIVGDSDKYLVSSAYILGIFTFCALFLYMKNTIRLIRPITVVSMLVSEINEQNILDQDKKEEVLQPLFDIIHASIRRSDITTTRSGLGSLSDKLQQIIGDIEQSSDKINITKQFSENIKRSILVAFRQEDEGILFEIIEILEKYCIHCLQYEISLLIRPILKNLETIAIRATETGFEPNIIRVAKSLKQIAIRSSAKKWENIPVAVSNYLEKIGNHSIEKGMERSARCIIIYLDEIGINTADNDLKASTIRVVTDLYSLGLYTYQKDMHGATKMVAFYIDNIQNHVAEKGWNIIENSINEDLLKWRKIEFYW